MTRFGRRPLRVTTYAVTLDARGYVIPGREIATAPRRRVVARTGPKSLRYAVVESWRRGRTVLVTGTDAAPYFVSVWR